MYVYMDMYVCISDNTGKSALPDIIMHTTPKGECVYIRQSMSACVTTNTVFYWLLAMAIITFSKRKGAATKQGWLLYEGGH